VVGPDDVLLARHHAQVRARPAAWGACFSATTGSSTPARACPGLPTAFLLAAPLAKGLKGGHPGPHQYRGPRSTWSSLSTRVGSGAPQHAWPGNGLPSFRRAFLSLCTALTLFVLLPVRQDPYAYDDGHGAEVDYEGQLEEGTLEEADDDGEAYQGNLVLPPRCVDR
jgi:hypothetical protein